MIWYLYVITNSVNGKQYVGVATNPRRRWCEHKCGHGSKILKRAMRKYGKDNFTFAVWYRGSKSRIMEMEQKFIALLKAMVPNGYNLTQGGEGNVGWKPSAETIEKMRARGNSGNGMLGKHHSDETKRLLAECRAPYVRGKSPVAKSVTINGIRYECIADAAETLQINYSTLAKRIAKGFQDVTKCQINNRAKRVLVNWIEYGSITDAAEALGVTRKTLRNRFRKWHQSGEWPDGFGYLDSIKGCSV